MSAVTMRRKNMNRIELVPQRSAATNGGGGGCGVGLNSSCVLSPTNNATSPTNNTTIVMGEGTTSKGGMISSARGSNQDKKNSPSNQNRPSTTSSIFSMTSSVKSAKIVESRSSLIKKANDRFAHKKMSISDRNSTFPGVNEYRFAKEKEDIMESVLDKINNLSNHSYFTGSDDGKSQKSSDLFIMGKAPSVSQSQQSTESQLSSQSQYQRQYIEWKNAKEINESSKQIAETIKKREGHVPFGTFGVFQTGNSIYKRDFITEDALKKRMNEIEIEERGSYVLNNPWEKNDDDEVADEENNKEDSPIAEQTANAEENHRQTSENEGNNNSRACTPMDIDKRSSSSGSAQEEDPIEIIGEEPHPEGQSVAMINVTKPTDFDAASVFSCSTHHSLYSRRYAPSTCSSTFSTGKKGIKGGKAKYMPRPMASSLIEPRLKTSSSAHSSNSQTPPPTSPSSSTTLSKSLNIDDVRKNFTPISSRHNFPQGRKNTFNSIIRSSDVLSTN
ncbi:predicted protein [Naegleria gruberi]|uniref:Predicted protein n=1 Tax=Naegleria gruberi TaxID=5762 RepID=D2W061_NAEGR|nr:uncharacterized protein NAEGRDRAFT_74744 [Naegleria gruberi]EFC37516.1 predicted protein [Naegleria gruberi]|eukprot:XP_002670260.1 predicted protein [Naegleria gruberi strain NEG-M]